MKSSNFNRGLSDDQPEKKQKKNRSRECYIVDCSSLDGKSLTPIDQKCSLICQEGVGVRISASIAPSLTYRRAHITPIDPDDTPALEEAEAVEGDERGRTA